MSAEPHVPWWDSLPTVRKIAKVYNAAYVPAILAWIGAWWFLGLRTLFVHAGISEGRLVFFEFMWMPFGVAQLFIVGHGLRLEIRHVRGLATQMQGEYEVHMRRLFLLAAQSGIDLGADQGPLDHPTLQ